MLMLKSFPTRPLIIIPTYNERENMAQLIPEIFKVDERFHILVVDDGSPDDTAGAVRELKEKKYSHRLFLIARPVKLGLGNAYIHGFNWGLSRGYDFLIQMDGDWSHHPRYLARMLQLAGVTDFVIGSRYVPEGNTLHWGAGRRLLSKFGSYYSRAILRAPFADFTGGFNGWSADVLRKIGLNESKSNGYSFQIELKYQAYKMGFKHIEYPIVFDERRAGQSKMSATIAFEAFYRIWQFKFMSRTSRRIF
jgi:dolichol-phosphate mannosyltransferase